MYKHLIFVFALFNCSLLGKDGWQLIGKDRAFAISGIAELGNLIVVVHDNKRDYEGRIGLVLQSGDSLKYRLMEWPDKSLPFDLEALATVPGSLTDLVAMESRGRCHFLIFNHAKMRLSYNGTIQIPGLSQSTNLEGFGLMKTGNRILAVWGHRGRSEQPGKLYWGWMDFQNRGFQVLDSLEISVAWPTQYVRHIADLKITEQGDCWVAASSDPGDDGPFSSALYRIGRFQFIDNKMKFYQVLSRSPAYKFSGHKVEGFELNDRYILLATDDENFGGFVKTIYLK